MLYESRGPSLVLWHWRRTWDIFRTEVLFRVDFLSGIDSIDPDWRTNLWRKKHMWYNWGMEHRMVWWGRQFRPVLQIAEGAECLAKEFGFYSVDSKILLKAGGYRCGVWISDMMRVVVMEAEGNSGGAKATLFIQGTEHRRRRSRFGGNSFNFILWNSRCILATQVRGLLYEV